MPPRFTPINGKPMMRVEGGEGSSASPAVLCLCGVGAAQAAEEARLVEGLRRLLAEVEDDDEEAASSVEVVVEPNRTFLALPSHSTAERFHARWHNHTLPNGLATHNVCIRWAVPYKDRRNPTPEDSVAATAHVRVPGLGLLAEFLTTEKEETVLIALLDARPWDEASLKGRRSQHYGACAIDFRTRDINGQGGGGGAVGVPPIPPACAALVERARALLLDGEGQGADEDGSDKAGAGAGGGGGERGAPPPPKRRRRAEGPLAGREGAGRDQLTVNDYQPGEGIAGHIDVHSLFEDCFLILSLGSDCVMDFRRADPPAHKAVRLPRRSLLVLEGEARYWWSHGIASRKSDCGLGGEVVARGRRVSLSFRRVRSPRVSVCAFPDVCDWQQQGQGQGQGGAGE